MLLRHRRRWAAVTARVLPLAVSSALAAPFQRRCARCGTLYRLSAAVCAEAARRVGAARDACGEPCWRRFRRRPADAPVSPSAAVTPCHWLAFTPSFASPFSLLFLLMMLFADASVRFEPLMPFLHGEEAMARRAARCRYIIRAAPAARAMLIADAATLRCHAQRDSAMRVRVICAFDARVRTGDDARRYRRYFVRRVFERRLSRTPFFAHFSVKDMNARRDFAVLRTSAVRKSRVQAAVAERCAVMVCACGAGDAVQGDTAK